MCAGTNRRLVDDRSPAKARPVVTNVNSVSLNKKNTTAIGADNEPPRKRWLLLLLLGPVTPRIIRVLKLYEVL